MKPIPSRTSTLAAAVALLAACGGGGEPADGPDPVPDPPAAFTLELEHQTVPVGQGAIASLGVTVVRAAGFTGAVSLEVTGLPAGVTAPPATVAANATTADLAFVAAHDAPHSLPTQITVRGTSGAESAARTALLTVFGAPGALDTSFGGGSIVTPVGGGEDFAEAIAVQADGKIVVVGSTTGVGGTDVAVVRYGRDGGLDPGFGTGGEVVTVVGSGDSKALAVAVQPDGKIVVAGFATGDATGVDFAVVRYLPDGKPDPGFGSGGQVLVPFGDGVDKARALAIQPDGRIVVAGDASFATTGQDFALARLETDGDLDATFAGGKVTTPVKAGNGGDIVYALALVTVGGETRVVAAGGEGDFAVARYTAAGALDGSFSGDGVLSGVFGSSIGSAYAAAADAEGRVVLAGHVGHDFALLRLDTAGAPDDGFGSAGKTTVDVSPVGSWDEATAVAVQADGRILAGGWVFAGPGSAADFALVRTLEDGQPDGSFGVGGSVITPVAGAKNDAAHALALQPDDRVPTTRIVLAGGANGSNHDFAVTRYWP